MQTTHVSTTPLPSRQALITVDIPTATAILYKRGEPYLVLVGESSKHAAPVLPGGKIDIQDLVLSSREQTAKNCIIRELQEEVGLTGREPQFLAVHSDPDRDKRIITAGSLKGTLVGSALSTLQDEQPILGRYGVPDYVFTVEAGDEMVRESDELKDLQWIDSRDREALSLGARHRDILDMYLQWRSGQLLGQ